MVIDMKAAIITRHAISNYGSLLQAFATEEILRDMGIDPVTIDYIRTDERPENIPKLLLHNSTKWNKNLLTRGIYYLIQQPNHVMMGRAFRRFQKEWLTLTPDTYASFEELKQSGITADVYCTGSDQVWGDIANDLYDQAYFLRFVPDNCKKVSIAASMGYTTIPEEIVLNYKEALDSYHTITVREKSAAELLSGLTDVDVQQILDPTLLYEAVRWEKKTERSDLRNYVLLYQLNANPEMDYYAEQFAKKCGKKLVRVSPEYRNRLKSGKFVYLPTLGKFLALLKNADYMITDSLHGTAFAINFNIQFVEFFPKKKSTRNRSILELTGLMDRVVTDQNDYGYIEKKIDFTPVNRVIAAERKRSLEVIRKMIME